ncbi:MAG: SRPBCC domain-containing protein [Bacteroidota bacterium]
MEEKNDLAKRILTIKKTLNAPVELVWEAWTQPEHVAKWWGPNGMELKVIKHDFKVGGEWKYTMFMPDKSEFISEGVYSEIINLKKIVTSANFRPMTEGVEMRSLFEGDGDKTHFTFSVVHPTEEYKIQQEKMGFYNGWGSAFKRLETFLDTLIKKS